ncbi:hypothetical protein BGX33_012420, partial [Mortierella sp. NVP41]
KRNWYDGNDEGYQYQYQQEEPEERTAFEKMFYNEPSSSTQNHNHKDYYNYDNENPGYDYNSNSNYGSGYDFPQYDYNGEDTFGAFDEHSDQVGAGALPGSDCRGYFCSETHTCVDQPINCPCPHVLDTKCLRSDWFVCYRGPHQC